MLNSVTQERVMSEHQYTFFGDHHALEALSQSGDRLEQLDKILDLAPLVALADKIWNEARPLKANCGRSRESSEVMLRALLLKRFYNLSNEQTEYQLRDRLSFMRFARLGLGDKVPDSRTIWLYADSLAKNDGALRLFELLNEQLEQRGLKVQEGMMVDATIVEVPHQRNSREQNKTIKEGQIPEQWKSQPRKLAQKDLDARWLKKNGQSHYGYKNHVKIGARTKLIKKFRVSEASEHDSQKLPSLVDETDTSCHADSAYSGQACAEHLKKCGVANHVHEKGTRAKALSEEQKRSNTEKSRIRARVEHPFAFMQKSLGGIYNRCIGMVRNAHEIGMMNLSYNLWRGVFLLRQAAN